MLSIIRAALDLLVSLVRYFSRRERQRRQEQSARRAEREITDAIEAVSRPELDPSSDSADPMGIDRWNRGRSA